ncbi:hypothetical protein JCM4814A_81140 [Streptomyces phaeofaciens JCM 4814]|uniref:Uncharacterized protein n=1 Tax=Streptomyces phaeofaciens TaxID=68254 RepID=A0A918M252_9ACTN|nr:hypothetical protein [Streptomyces phaeofaciens]GGT99433.1 hypothetical protein GCM10010226_90680 [Streptomyces phaeofaciens]
MTGLLRGPWGVALVLAYLLNAYVAYGALTIQPQGVWDESTLTAIEFASALLITLVLTFLIGLFPVRRRSLSRWWLAPAVVFLAMGSARWTYIVQTYPQGPGS